MPKFLKYTAGIVSLLFVIGIILANGRQPEPLPEGSVSAQRLANGPLMVHSHDETFIDTSRKSMAHGSYAGSDQRELVTTLWHPADNSAGPYPLIVYSHGFSSMRRESVYLAEHLASHGYVVVAADYPLTNMSAPDRPFVMDVINQPRDVSFLIDSLLVQSADETHMLAGMIDDQRIGVTGISLGGMTSTMAAFHPVTGDSRIDASLSIAGPTAQFTELFYRQPKVPFLMLAGDIDALVPYESNAYPVLANVPGSQLVTIAGASHSGFAGAAGIMRWMDNPDVIGCYIVAQNIESDMEGPWYDQLGTPEQGINYDAKNDLCLMDPLPTAMNPLRQHMVTALVVRAFFDSELAATKEERASAANYLSTQLTRELHDVDYARAGEG